MQTRNAGQAYHIEIKEVKKKNTEINEVKQQEQLNKKRKLKH